ncbi:hypothetical protein Leryth_022917 [Lithospermum erythrorhizon]|nr:hypothetical protein Leryth_022917 [Lithospermum erythrorhizon]
MDYKSSEKMQDDTERSRKDDATNYLQPKLGTEGGLSSGQVVQEENTGEHTVFFDYDKDASPVTAPPSAGEVNMEASIMPDDVTRAGGLGTRDDISSMLPVAADSTDFEAALRDAREYEEPQGKISRPGLGWGRNSE